mgnify:FL=1
MALTKIGDLGNGVGLIYEVTPASAILNTYPNDRAHWSMLRLRCLPNAIIYAQNTGETGTYTEAFNDPDGNRYFVDSNSGATKVLVSADAIEITSYIMPITKNPVQAATINSDTLTLQRYGPVTVVDVAPQSGTADDLRYIKGLNFATKPVIT